MLLYVRMLFTMLVGLYTSRVILNTLGVTDFGIFNVVGGIIGMLGFITSSLGGASSRFITFGLGKDNIPALKRTFGNILAIHILLSLLILVIGETLGLWFLYNKMQIPIERFDAAFWVYQFSILSSILAFISIPYNSVIIAHEKMSAFTYISIADVILKLVIVYLLLVIPFDKLIVYAILFFCIQLFDQVIYITYCSRKFEETRTKPYIDKQEFKELFGFAFWTMSGNLSCIGYTQGLNILLNIFFGPTVNAARGIAAQVQSVVRNFCYNFQTAVNPQITKSYANGELTQMQNLVSMSSKYSFFLLFFLSLPLMLEAPLVLKWWLGVVPDYTVCFLRIILMTSIIIALSNPLIISIYATGNIKRFQILESSILLLILPISYILLKFYNVKPDIVFFVHLIIELLTQFVRIRIILPQIGMKIADYCFAVVFPILKVGIVSIVLPIVTFYMLDQNFLSFFAVCTISSISIIFSILYVGCNISERNMIISKLKKIFISK